VTTIAFDKASKAESQIPKLFSPHLPGDSKDSPASGGQNWAKTQI